MDKGVIDFHCDVLSKMLFDPAIRFEEDEKLDVSLAKLIQGGVGAQCFAVYLSERLGPPRFDDILRSIDLFRRRIVANPAMKWIRSQEDWIEWEQEASSGNKRIGALLSLEGADGLEADLTKLRICSYLGVRFLGITWNYANWAADGVQEARKGGFTAKGRRLVQECNRLGMLMDVSHLTERGFWQLAEWAEKPFIASHSNAYAVCPHPRNLRDEQIKHIIGMDGRIGITFVPSFVAAGKRAAVDDILRHIDHVCALGGERHIMFGSDFDGIEEWVEGLEHAGQYAQLRDSLSRHYRQELVERFLHGNASAYLKAYLPSRNED
ncbi:dipeptidase [Paenibacillus sp. MSJ-34]|uniref:dipeptidase n=1 Tax=Paenibacillus sp. MSJ-34 TaxID=2841529 RepID=UPI001C0FD989|nr:dipeptidase [Paenibacillus sp. MSJ-34]MBU5441843.1 dipeptidase [Paenibacillus sp. MSJ-34]